ncbi:tetratricopeptide repeat protein [Mangrovimonas xylaniphaga]|uniref:tetratricopeptide repeat protein n=1 Tax=Mangrovimonas xylaniphaga TaxID=1645915 RepID=UPI0006B66ED2|nr:tetratricopeptide repeat protein [Mangrovimonas xylaniphaga]
MIKFKTLVFFVGLGIVCNMQSQTAVLDVADSLFANGNYSKAIAHYKSYEAQGEVADKIARSYVAIGNYDEALSYYETSVGVKPNDALIAFEYARLLSKTRKFDDASTVFRGLIAIDESNPNYHYELGLVLEEQRDSMAVHSFQRTYDLDPAHQKAIYKLAKEHMSERKFEAANILIDKGLEGYANNVSLVNLKAQNYYHQQDYELAIVWFEKLIEMGESSAFVHEKLSLCYAQEYKYEKAIEHRKLVLKYDPYDATTMYVLGTYYEELQDYPNAEKYIVQFLALKDVALVGEYTKLGTIYNRQEKYKEAIEAFQKAVKENPEDISAAFFLVISKDKYYADYDAKVKVYNDFKVKYPNSPFTKIADRRLQELKEEKFLSDN